MRINDQGFTERLSSSTNRSDETKAAGSSSSSSTSKLSGGSSADNLQLSSIASHLQSLGSNDSDRAARVSQIAKAVGNNTYQISAAKISQAVVSEAVQSAAA
jgi:anti-sigma28 factor (negative regulator of flagellin synthesis)